MLRLSLGQTGKAFLKGFILIASLIAAGLILRLSGITEHLQDKIWIGNWIKEQGLWGEFVLVGMMALAQSAGIPRQAICFAAGYAMGFWTGFLLCMMASLLGCFVNFYYARFLGRSLIQTRLAQRLQKLDGFWQKNPFSVTLMLRLTPFSINVVTNLLAGVSSVAALPFFAGSMVGYIPQTLIFVLLGTGIGLDATDTVALSIVLFVVSTGLGLFLFQRFRASKRLAAAGLLSEMPDSTQYQDDQIS